MKDEGYVNEDAFTVTKAHQLFALNAQKKM